MVVSRVSGIAAVDQPRLCPPPTIPRMAIAPDVCIRGAGIVGRTLALLLARDRLRVGLVSDRRSGRRRGQRRARLCAERRLAGTARAPARLARRAARHAGAGHGGPRRRWRQRALRRAGRRARRRWPGSSMSRPCRSGWPRPCATSRWSSGSTRPQPAPLTVVCEGKASATRAEFGVQFDVTPYPQRAIAARLHCEKPHGADRAPVVRRRRNPGFSAPGRRRRRRRRELGGDCLVSP